MDAFDKLDVVTPGLRGLIAGTRQDQLDLQTPCAKWQVRDLMNHVIGGGHVFAAMYRGEPTGFPEGDPPDLVGDDPASAWDDTVADFGAAIRSDGAMERMIPLPFGELPGSVVLELSVFDLLVHSWDLATATGQTFSPPEALVVEAAAFARQAIPPEARDGDTFAAEVDAPPGASALQRLVAFTGRQP